MQQDLSPFGLLTVPFNTLKGKLERLAGPQLLLPRVNIALKNNRSPFLFLNPIQS